MEYVHSPKLVSDSNSHFPFDGNMFELSESIAFYFRNLHRHILPLVSNFLCVCVINEVNITYLFEH